MTEFSQTNNTPQMIKSCFGTIMIYYTPAVGGMKLTFHLLCSKRLSKRNHDTHV